MIIEIDDKVRISDLKDTFHAVFPFLGIEFFSAAHDWGKASPVESRLSPDKTIGELRTVQGPASMEIYAWHTTGAVEQEFGKIFGLYIQVFRRDGAAWLQTVETDTRTLEEQNQAGRNSAQELLDGTDFSFNSENPV